MSPTTAFILGVFVGLYLADFIGYMEYREYVAGIPEVVKERKEK